jgi:4-hydroxybenzoate polyprenyltransferase
MFQLIKYLRTCRSLLRLPTYLLMMLYLIMGFLLGLHVSGMTEVTVSELVELLLSAIVIAAWYIGGSGLNDFADYEIDMINLKDDPNRPLVSEVINRKELFWISIVCIVIAILLTLLLSRQHQITLILLAVLSIGYSLPPVQISRRGALAPLLLPLGYIILPFFFGYYSVANSIEPPFVYVTFAFYLHFIGRIILKDYRDVKGDKKHNKMTFLLRYGSKAVCIVSGLSVFTGSVITYISLSENMSIFRYPFVFLLFFGLFTLNELSKTNKWKNQKPLLSSFGRVMTGVTAVTIMTLTIAIWPISVYSQIFLSIILGSVYTWSATQTFRYNS